MSDKRRKKLSPEEKLMDFLENNQDVKEYYEKMVLGYRGKIKELTSCLDSCDYL